MAYTNIKRYELYDYGITNSLSGRNSAIERKPLHISSNIIRRVTCSGISFLISMQEFSLMTGKNSKLISQASFLDTHQNIGNWDNTKSAIEMGLIPVCIHFLQYIHYVPFLY